MNYMKLNSRMAASEIMDDILDKINNEMGLKRDCDKFDTMYYIIEFIREQKDKSVEAYKNEDFSQVKRDLTI